MQIQPMMTVPFYFKKIQMVDADFDLFEINPDYEIMLRDTEIANFYDDTLTDEETQ